jgi:hypothetical protein
MSILTGPCIVAERQQLYLGEKMSAFFSFFSKSKKVMSDFSLMACLYFLNLASLLFPCCRREEDVNLQSGGCEAQGLALSGGPSIYKEMTGDSAH